MTRVTVDDVLRQKLENFSRAVEICDEQGKVIARVMPVLDPSEYEPLEPRVSEEELQRRENSDEERFSTADVLKHLENL